MHQVTVAEASIAPGREQGIAAQEIDVLNWTVCIGSISETGLFVISASPPFQEVLAHPQVPVAKPRVWHFLGRVAHLL